MKKLLISAAFILIAFTAQNTSAAFHACLDFEVGTHDEDKIKHACNDSCAPHGGWTEWKLMPDRKCEKLMACICNGK